ncbi:beta-ketoacyl synthase N-terminal-like domain-containing protein [Longimicrobium sp.]|uniref:type I polyketide synthase n=1 Tax=Longimicrobium sp. TaxID=2029185 RepID=UPI003B3AD4E4
MREHEQDRQHDDEQGGEFDVAIVGLAGRFPGADDLDAFWGILREGRETITHFTDDEMRAAGVPDELLAMPGFVKAAGRLRDIEHFDAGFFGYSPREAQVLEPAHRIFLECAWEALESAGYTPERAAGRVGVYAGAGTPMYYETHVLPNEALVDAVGGLAAALSGGKDFIATRVAYKLGLRGPALSVQTACSTSLVAVHLAVQSLLSGESDMALAGGATVHVPQVSGYVHGPGTIVSPDGHCRTFDARSGGTVSGSGVGVVALKRLADALRDGDPVRAVIKGSAINNDGAARVAFSAPGVEGQSSVITEALAAADVHPTTIQYVEAHGSATDLGDVIEIAALKQAYGAHTGAVGFCTVGAVKSNTGHLDIAAGVTGLIKTVLSMEHAQIPPTVHFTAPNPKLGIENSPFIVRGALTPWTTDGGPRRAGVSSFGIGGTNAHVIVEEAPRRAPSGPSRPWQTLAVSARTPGALDAATDRLAAHLEAHPDLPLADVAFTLQEGRRAFAYRRTVVVRAGEEAARLVRERTPERTASALAETGSRSVAFLFPGLGDHYPGMARGLYEAEPAFRAEVDRCAQILRAHLGMDIREVLFPGDAPSDAAPAGGIDLREMLGRSAPMEGADRLNRTELAQPAVFVIDYAMAKLWMSWGIVPDAVIGHSLGEYAAACISGVLSLEDALALVADRARMIQALPGGAMLAVSMDEADLRPLLSASAERDSILPSPRGTSGEGPGEGHLSIATVNAPGLTVVSGPEDAVAALEKALADAGRTARRLPTTHAFHSAMMQPAAQGLAARVARVRMSPPQIPMISNVTGTWITDDEAADPAYWTRHMLGTVRFAEGVAELLAEPGRVLLEVGPGQTLSTFVRQRPASEGEQAPAAVIPSIRYAYDRKPDAQFLAEALGRLWLAGVEPDWRAYRAGERRRRLVLPTYPWEKQRYWVDPPADASTPPARAADTARRPDPADWTYLPTWTRTPAAAASAPKRILLAAESGKFADRLEAAFRESGHFVRLLRSGSGFSADGDRLTVRPDSREDFAALAEHFHDSAAPEIVVHALHDAAGALGSFALLADAAAVVDGARLVVLTAGAQEVTGDEDLSPAAAALVGAARVAAQEYPTLGCRVIDVALADTAAATAGRVAAEAVSDAEELVVAYRGRHRWVRGFRAARPSAPAARIREGGAYAFVGALGPHAIALARAVARTPDVRIALVTPAALAHAATDVLAEAGARVTVFPAESGDAGALADALREVEAQFGALAGVICAPAAGGVAELGGIAAAEPAVWARQLAAYAADLDALAMALEGRAPEFVLVELPLAGGGGGVGQARLAAAATLAEAAAARHGWTAVAWDRWNHGGDDPLGMVPDEMPAALYAVLALAGQPSVLVSTNDLEARIRAASTVAVPGEGGATLYERPSLNVEYTAPTNEVEEQLAELWSGLLGIEKVGIHDDFFGLGGHSLLATQIMARVRDLFHLDLPLQSIFEAPTIARYALLIEDVILAELESLTEEEAAGLMG